MTIMKAKNFRHNNALAKALLGSNKPALITDFDGTLSELQNDPTEASIDLNCLALLRNLSLHLPYLAILSGRDATQLANLVDLEEVAYFGNHGAESIIEGNQYFQEYSEPDLSDMRELFSNLQRTVRQPGIFWEFKKISASVHFRMSNIHRAKYELQEALRIFTIPKSIDIFWGREIMEIRLRSSPNKGTALESIVSSEQLMAAIYIGDDTTDLDAIKTFYQMKKNVGLKGFSVAVKSENMNNDLLRYADLFVSGIEGVETLLTWLYKRVTTL